MLKWAVNTPRLSYLSETDCKVNTVDLQLKTLTTLSTEELSEPSETPSTQTRTLSTKRQRHKRTHSESHLPRRLQNWLGKENQFEERNQVTSTPLHSTSKTDGKSCSFRHLNSLKDLSNIIAFETFNNNTLPKSIAAQMNTPNQSLESCRLVNNNPSNYAATLPTLEVEYSPCGLVPGPILALRGVGIADTYFDKPRYLPTDQQSLAQSQSIPAISARQSQPNTHISLNSVRNDTTSLSSSKMGDQTLERMIDAILESTRKEKRHMKFARHYHHHQHVVMSPTYTPAEDPANDLSEFWSEERKAAPICKKRRSLPAKIAMMQSFNEREVRSSIGAIHRTQRLRDNNIFNLRRQRAIRRKRKVSNKPCGKTTKHSTHKNMKVDEAKVSPELAALNSTTLENASPDSGHNSCSELDENSITLANDCLPVIDFLENTDFRTLDATKRRLSFSNKTISVIQQDATFDITTA